MKMIAGFKNLSIVCLLFISSIACGMFSSVPAPTIGAPTVVPPAQNDGIQAPNIQAPAPTFAVPTPVPVSQCPTDKFIDVSTYKPRSGWPAPRLKVMCDANSMTIETNGVPNFNIHLKQNDELFSVKLPLNPQKANQPVDFRGGIIGVAVNGVQIWAPVEAPQDGFADPIRDRLTEICNGHALPFHFHANPTCLFPSQENQTLLVVGYALDGFSILAPYMCEDSACTQIRKVKSSWQISNPNKRNVWELYKYEAGSGDLDKCNGMIGPDGNYHYYATDTFPYTIACFSGTPTMPSGNTGAGQQPGGGGQPPPKP
jgi:hypothetical protein